MLLLPMLQLLQLLFPVVLLTAGATAQMLRLGPCPDLKSVSNFNITAYQGLWYENRKLKAWFEIGQKCITAEYQSLGGGVVYVENSAAGPLGIPISIKGYARLSGDSPMKGDLAVGFPQPPSETNYRVLDVEYDRYAFVYTCNTVKKFMRKEILWVLTRSRRISTSTQMELMRKLMRMGFKWFDLMPTWQRFCQRRPVLELGGPDHQIQMRSGSGSGHSSGP